jgi:cellulose synthase/poly-beta-1,6-N-acetylglucosamine synthase-like glycosyltransferase
MNKPPSPVSDATRLEISIGLLESVHPGLSARATASKGRRRGVLVTILAVVVVGMFAAPIRTLSVLFGITVLLYLIALWYRAQLMFRRGDQRPGTWITDDEARVIPDEDLPVYTVLIPAFHEPESVGPCLAAIGQLEYPIEKLDIKLLLEDDDYDTIAAARAAAQAHVELVLVPAAEPRTKPKALNYGLQMAQGSYVTIFDIEDVPDRLQLRRAVTAFDRLPPDTACLQATLAFYNSRQNQITRWFTLDYALWFSWFLPALVERGAVVPLGGTSNHFRTEMLVEAGAWDAYNVTEDADLGIRLRRLGYGVELLGSTTLEEANTDLVNWLKQRSRWYKGYLQTWMVHLRHPRTLVSELGWKNFVAFNFFVGGTPVLALTNVVTWALTFAWIAAKPGWIPMLFPGPIYYAALVSFGVGNFLCVYMGMICARETKSPDLMLSALLMPLYWAMMSFAALKAAVQLVVAPSFWEKTVHGMAAHGMAAVNAAQPGGAFDVARTRES